MHIPGKSLMRPKNSMFRNTDSRSIAYANNLRTQNQNADPTQRVLIDQIALRIEAGVGRTTTRNTNNQRKRRKLRSQVHCHGFHPSFN